MKVEANWNRAMAGERAVRQQTGIWTGMLQFTQPNSVVGGGERHRGVTIKRIHCEMFSDIVGGQPEVKGTGWRAGTLIIEFPPSYFNFATRITTLLQEATQVKTLNMEMVEGSGLLEALRSVEAGLIYTGGTAPGEAVIFLLYDRESSQIKAFTHTNSMEAVRRLLRRAQRDRGSQVRDPVNLLEALRPRQDGDGGNAAPQAGPSPPPAPLVVDVVVPPPNLDLGAQPQPPVEQQVNEQAPPPPAPAQGRIIVRDAHALPNFAGYDHPAYLVAVRRHFRDAMARNPPPADGNNNPAEEALQQVRRRVAIVLGGEGLLPRPRGYDLDQPNVRGHRLRQMPAPAINDLPGGPIVEDNLLVKYRPDQRGNPDFCTLDILEMMES